MKRTRSLFSWAWTLILLGCGGGSSMMTPPPPPPPAINGSFGLTAVDSATLNTIPIGGTIQSTPAGAVSATMRVDNTLCFDFFTPLTFSGNISPSGQLSMTSSAFQGQTLALTGMVSSDGKMITSGTFSMSGSCGNGIHGSLAGFQVP